MNWLYIANRALLVLAFLGGFSFITIYQITARWWMTDVGRNMMAFVVSETVLLSSAVMVWLFGDFAGRQAFGLVAFAMFTVASWWRTVTLARSVLKRRKADRLEPQATRSQSPPPM